MLSRASRWTGKKIPPGEPRIRVGANIVDDSGSGRTNLDDVRLQTAGLAATLSQAEPACFPDSNEHLDSVLSGVAASVAVDRAALDSSDGLSNELPLCDATLFQLSTFDVCLVVLYCLVCLLVVCTTCTDGLRRRACV